MKMTRQKIESILNQTLYQMPDRFTSYQYGKQLRKNGLCTVKENVRQDRFLIHYCDHPSPKTWVKRKTNPCACARSKFTEKNAIELLKEKGYRIFAPVTDWEEI